MLAENSGRFSNFKFFVVKDEYYSFLDLNECTTLADICEGGGTCINTEGSFRCECPPHLSIDPSGRICQGRLMRPVIVNITMYTR